MGEEMTTMISIGVELDADGLSSSKHIFEQIASDSADVVLDLRRVNRMDGSGLGALMHVMKRKAANGAKLWVVNVNGQPRDMLSDLKVLSMIEHVGDLGAVARDLRQVPAANALAQFPAE